MDTETISDVVNNPVDVASGSPEENVTDTATDNKLETTWSFWSSKKSKNFEESLKLIGSFNTINGFWGYYQKLKQPMNLPNNHDIYLFRENEKPMWENFPEGECIGIDLKKKSNFTGQLWEELLIACIGEDFGGLSVAGAVLKIRSKSDTLCVWLSNPRKKRALEERLKRVLGLPTDFKVPSFTFKTRLVR